MNPFDTIGAAVFSYLEERGWELIVDSNGNLMIQCSVCKRIIPLRPDEPYHKHDEAPYRSNTLSPPPEKKSSPPEPIEWRTRLLPGDVTDNG